MVLGTFEVETQLSKENQTELTIFPASDMLLREKDYQRGQSALEKQISKTLSPILKSYLEEILSSFHQKPSTFQIVESFYLYVTIKHGLYLIILKKIHQYSLMIIKN